MNLVIMLENDRTPRRPGDAGHERAARRLGSGCGGDADVRCRCGSLLAKLVAGAIELKCRRCKETWRIPLEAG